uniref:Cytochrome p450 n=1 Tax=Croton stellatopilosus TaxID=431156 RepID=A0A3G2CJY0_9ROSI|nr:cytochrome p450 [Croton stellatopilosus]
MEDFTFTSLTFLFIFVIFISFKAIKKRAFKSSTPILPPGPWKLPIIGNIHQLLGSSPHQSLHKLSKKYGPLMHLKFGEISYLVVSSPEVAKEFLKTHDLDFSDRPYRLAFDIVAYGCTNIVFSQYGAYWRNLRKICIMELLSPKRVESFRFIREQEVLNLIKTISSHQGSVINLSKMLFALTYGITSSAAFGKKYDHKAFCEAVDEVSNLSAGFSVADLYPSLNFLEKVSGLRPKLEKLHEKLNGILDRILEEHRNKKCSDEKIKEVEDLVDVLLKVQEHGDLDFPLTDDNIKTVLLDIFSAGSETSSTIVEWAMSEMIKNPRIFKKAQSEVREIYKGKENVDETKIHELKYLNCIIKETLRLHPSLPLVAKQSRANVEILGYDIPIKTKVLINLWAIGRDPKYWTKPESFCPERFIDNSISYKGVDFEFIPFGAGRRICPGISFALPNIELPLAQLLFHFDWKLGNGLKNQDLDMTEGHGLSIGRKHDLLVVPIASRT